MNTIDTQRTIRRAVLGASSLLAVAMLLGRLAGLVRELQLAAKFGLSHAADAAVLLLSIPDLVVSLLISGGLSAVLVPNLKSLSESAATHLFQRACLWSLVMFFCIAAAFATIPTAFFQVLAPGLPINSSVPRAAILCVAISIPLTAITGVTGAYLNANDRFLITGLGTLFFNVVIIVILFGTPAEQAMEALGFAILIGAACRLLSQLISMPRSVFRIIPSNSVRTPPIFRSFLLGTAATSLILLPPMLVRALASFFAPGSVAAFNYAQKLIELPVGVLITAIGTVALTRLSDRAQDGASDLVFATLLFTVRLALIAAGCVMLFGYPLMRLIVEFLFLRGEMNLVDVQIITELAMVALAGVPFVAINSTLSASLYAKHETIAVLRANGTVVVVCALFAIPGLLAGNPQLLMAAVVASQMLLSIMLVRRSSIGFYGDGSIADRQFVQGLFWASVLALPFIGGALAFAETSVVTAFVIAGAGFCCSAAVALCLMARDPKV